MTEFLKGLLARAHKGWQTTVLGLVLAAVGGWTAYKGDQAAGGALVTLGLGAVFGLDDQGKSKE